MTLLRRFGAPALLIALTLALWAGVLRVPFQFDDFPTIVRDEATRDAGEWWWRLSHGVRPLLRTSFFLDHAIWGMNPAGYHATNLALHVATVLGVFALARRRLTGNAREIAALIAAAVFAIQPANAEVVAYVSGRSTGMMTAFLVAALLAHERARESAARRRIAWHVASAALAIAACLAKEVGLIFPALLAVWELTRDDAAMTRKIDPTMTDPGSDRVTSTDPVLAPEFPILSMPVIAATAATALAILIAGLLALSPRYRFLASYSVALRGPLDTFRVNLCAVPVMVSLWFRPWALSVDHGFDPSKTTTAAAVAGALMLTGLVLEAAVDRRRAPISALAIAWVLLALAPTNSFIAKSDPITEKPLYLAWIGPSLAIGALAAWSLAKARAHRFAPAMLATAAAIFAAIVLAESSATVARVAVWQDPRALWNDAVAKAPKHARAWNNLGMAYSISHENRRARHAFAEAVRLDPHDVIARKNLARLDVICGDSCE